MREKTDVTVTVNAPPPVPAPPTTYTIEGLTEDELTYIVGTLGKEYGAPAREVFGYWPEFYGPMKAALTPAAQRRAFQLGQLQRKHYKGSTPVL